MAQQALTEVFGKIQELESVEGGLGVETQAEVFRLWGLVDWILRLEGRRTLQQMENRTLANNLHNGMINAKEQLKSARIPVILVPRGNASEAGDKAGLGPSSSGRPTLQQLEAVFPILMKKKRLDPVDLLNLSNVHPSVAAFMLRHFEDVKWKDVLFLSESSHTNLLPLKKLAEDGGQSPVVSKIHFPLNGEDFRMDLLRLCGQRICRCEIFACPYLPLVENLRRLSACLQLMPNIKALFIADPEADSDMNLEMLPDLPGLKNLKCFGGPKNSLFHRAFIRRYGAQLEWLCLYSCGNFQQETPLPKGAVLKELHVHTSWNEDIYSQLGVFGNCPIKTLDIEFLDDCPFRPRQFLFLIANHWGDTLEDLQFYIGFPDVEEEQDSTWMVNLRFPKLKRLKTTNYGISENWDFLLLFPELETLEYLQSRGVPNGTREARNQPIVQLSFSKPQMLRSHIWKLFPKLEKITFGVRYGKVDTLTRNECVAFQRNN